MHQPYVIIVTLNFLFLTMKECALCNAVSRNVNEFIFLQTKSNQVVIRRVITEILSTGKMKLVDSNNVWLTLMKLWRTNTKQEIIALVSSALTQHPVNIDPILGQHR